MRASAAAILAASALTTVAVAKPLPQTPPYSRKGFSVKQSVQVPGRSGPAYLAKTYAKYGRAVPENIIAASQADGSVVATPEAYDVSYLCPVTVGGQTLNLDFDTGSSDLWVFSSELPASQSSGHSIYNPSKSNSSKKLTGASWKISYGDGSGASGDVYTDTVTIGGTTVTKQAVEPAATISAQFQQDVDNDGLVGLAFSSINTVTPKPQTTFFDTAIAQGVLKSNLFTADLKKGEPGSYDFGYIDSSKYTGDITYTAVDSSQGFWTFNSEVSGTSITGIADTGTTLMLLPDDVVDGYWQQVTGATNDSQQGGYTFDCSTDLPDFVVTVEGADFTVPGSYLNLSPITDGSTTCFGGLQSSTSIGTNIYGDVFLKAIFAVFDSDGPQLGLAAKSQ